MNEAAVNKVIGITISDQREELPPSLQLLTNHKEQSE